jgi:hypothetical protein
MLSSSFVIVVDRTVSSLLSLPISPIHSLIFTLALLPSSPPSHRVNDAMSSILTILSHVALIPFIVLLSVSSLRLVPLLQHSRIP